MYLEFLDIETCPQNWNRVCIRVGGCRHRSNALSRQLRWGVIALGHFGGTLRNNVYLVFWGTETCSQNCDLLCAARAVVPAIGTSPRAEIVRVANLSRVPWGMVLICDLSSDRVRRMCANLQCGGAAVISPSAHQPLTVFREL